ncbi:outer membrane protein assembly factor BamB family protein [Kitasatospora sp. NPDC004240]
MAGDHPTPGAGETPGSGAQESRGVPLGRKPGVDPAAVADQMTQLGGAPVPAQGAPAAPSTPPAAPPAPPAAPAPGTPAPGTEYAYAPTAAFPSQPPGTTPPMGTPAGAPVGPFDPAPTPSPFPAQGGPYGYAAPPAPGPATDGYGYPAGGQHVTPPYGFPGPPAPVARQRNPVMLWGGIIGSVLVVAIIAGLVVLFGGDDDDKKDDPVASTAGTTGGASSTGTGGTTTGSSSGGTATGGGGTKAGTYALSWSAPKSATSSSGSLLAVWGTDKVIVRGDTNGIKAYNSSDGKEAWSITPPAGTKEFCSMSYGMNSNKIAAVSLNTGDSDCSTIGAVDVANGKLLWSAKVSTTRLSSPSLSLTDNVIVVGGSSAFGAVKITDGSAAWQYTPRDKSCSLYGEAAGTQLVVSDRCYGGSGPKSTLTVLDAESGKAASQAMTLEGTIERVEKVISDKPLVVEMASGVNGDYILSFDKDNKPIAKMPTKEAGSDSLRLSGTSEPYTLNIVSGTTLYVQVDASAKGSINAYDLTTGKRLWSAAGTTERGLRLISGTDKEGKVRAVAVNGYGKESKVVQLNPADGAVTDLGPIGEIKSSLISLSSTEYILRSDGTLAAFPRSSGYDTPVAMFAKK